MHMCRYIADYRLSKNDKSCADKPDCAGWLGCNFGADALLLAADIGRDKGDAVRPGMSGDEVVNGTCCATRGGVDAELDIPPVAPPSSKSPRPALGRPLPGGGDRNGKLAPAVGALGGGSS
jgi:hypothetical protein